MDMERIRELVQLMVDNQLSELDIQDGQDRVSLKRGPSGVMVTPLPAVPAAGVAAPTVVAVPAEGPKPPEEKLIPIVSPMVGTFYAAPSPDSPSYVEVGSEIGPDTVVCIVEAMKVMNEIKAEVAGTVVKVVARNGQAVEYGQPMFMVRPG